MGISNLVNEANILYKELLIGLKNRKKYPGEFITQVLLALIENQHNFPEKTPEEDKLFCIDFNYKGREVYGDLIKRLSIKDNISQTDQMKINLYWERIPPEIMYTPEYRGFVDGLIGVWDPDAQGLELGGKGLTRKIAEANESLAIDKNITILEMNLGLDEKELYSRTHKRGSWYRNSFKGPAISFS